MSVFDNKQAMVAKIVGVLEKVIEQPAKFLGDDDPASLLMWLEGFTTACTALDIRQGYVGHDAIQKLVAIEHGWEYRSTGLVAEMQERGWRDEAIIEEVLYIEIETWKRSYGI